MRRRRMQSSASISSLVENDASLVPGKPFLEHLHRVLKGYSDDEADTDSSSSTPDKERLRRQFTSTRKLLVSQHDATSPQPLALNAACLCYLQKLLYAMLTPTKSQQSGLITQWRLSAAFAEQLESPLDPKHAPSLGAASPGRMLQLAGHLFEVDTLHIDALSAEVDLPVPSDFDLLIFPRLSRLHLDGIDISLVRGLTSVADILTELHYSNATLHTLAPLLAPHGGSSTPLWPNLRALRVDNAQLDEIEAEVLDHAPNLESATFRNNYLDSFGALPRCEWLSSVDLSYNRLYSLDIRACSFEHLKVLNLSHNQISSVQSLRGCKQLEVLDLSFNLILNVDELHQLRSLLRLQSVYLIGNPVSKTQFYRQRVRKMLSDGVVLDDVPWKVQDFADFTTKIDSVRPQVVTTDMPREERLASKTNFRFSERVPRWSMARGVLRSSVAIGSAQVVVSTLWSRDHDAERVAMWIVAITVAFGGLSVLLTLLVSSCCEFYSRVRPTEASKCKDGEADVEAAPRKSSIHSFTRGLSMNLATVEADLLVADREYSLRIEEFSHAIQEAILAGDDLDLAQLEDVCTYLKAALAYLSDLDGGGLGFAWVRLNRAMQNLSPAVPGDRPHELVRDLLSSRVTLALDAAEPSNSPTTSLTKVLPVIRMSAIIFSSIMSDSNMSEVLRDAYVQVFASRHKWWRQRAVVASFSTVPETDAFLEWLHSTCSHSQPSLLHTIHKCGERLQLLHASVQELVDEHVHSYSHHR